jgi:outer membrane protein TolC
MKITSHILLLIIVVSSMFDIRAQSESISLEECFELARQNYPQIKQLELIRTSTAFSVDNVQKQYLPQISIKGQASYQSDVTQLPVSLPGITIVPPSNDQYKIYGEINQPLTDLLTVKKHKELVELNGVITEQNLEIQLYQIKERINQVYFGVVLLDAQLALTDVLKNELDSSMIRVKSAVSNGISISSKAILLEIEQIHLAQKVIELKSARSSYLEMLSTFINKPLDGNSVLILPAKAKSSHELKRPELALFEQQKNQLNLHNDLLTAKNMPHLGFFFQGGYGRPGLNFLSNEFDAYYITGLQLNWSISGLYILKKERNIISLNQSIIDTKRETFEFNTKLVLNQQERKIDRIEQLIEQDDKISELHEEVLKVANSQLENGMITTLDYVSNLNALDQARLSKVNHEIQLLLAQQQIQLTTGN